MALATDAIDLCTLTVERCGASGPRSIHAETLGERDSSRLACVGIHGGPNFTAASMRLGLDALAASRPVVLFDLPGCGRSSRHRGSGYPLADYADDVIAVIDATGGGRVVLVAHAWGAILAVETALRAPSRIAALVLVNPLRILNEHGQDEAAQRRRIDAVDPTLIPRFRALADVVSRARGGDLDAWDDPALVGWSREMFATQFARTAPHAWRDAMQGAQMGMESYAAHKGAALDDEGSHWGRFDLRARARHLVQPVFVIASDDDANYVAPPERHARPLAASIASAELEVLDGVGHFLFAEATETFVERVSSWIARRIE